MILSPSSKKLREVPFGKVSGRVPFHVSSSMDPRALASLPLMVPEAIKSPL
jgi:hypothetical protein